MMQVATVLIFLLVPGVVSALFCFNGLRDGKSMSASDDWLSCNEPCILSPLNSNGVQSRTVCIDETNGAVDACCADADLMHSNGMPIRCDHVNVRLNGSRCYRGKDCTVRTVMLTLANGTTLNVMKFDCDEQLTPMNDDIKCYCELSGRGQKAFENADLSPSPSTAMPLVTTTMKTTMLNGVSPTTTANNNDDWGYEGTGGPDSWPGICHNGQRQSPINFARADVEYQHFDRLHFRHYDQSGEPVTVVDNGHTLLVSGFDTWKNQPFLSGGGLQQRYNLVQFHLHWSQDGHGSEHSVAGAYYPEELHFVHLKENTTMSQALAQNDGLAVVAVFVVIGTSGRAMRALEPALLQIEHENDAARLDSIRLINLLPDNANAFYRYNGSLTSPGCQETVIWTVLTDPISVTEQQMTDLRQMRDAHDQVLDHNNRPPQNLNGRRIFSSSTSNLPPSDAVCPFATFTLLFILFALVLL